MVLWLVAAAYASDVLVAHGRVWDGTGGPATPDVDVLIHDDRIVAIGHDLVAPEGARILDAAGATVIPGLIDSHVHLSMDPGAAHRTDTPATHRELLTHHLRAYLACGVTTILDPAVLPAEHALIREAIASGAGPRYLALGPPFSPPEGYVAIVIDGFPSVATVEDVERQLDAVVAQGAIGVKVTIEFGFVSKIWPMHTPEILAAIRAGAAARGLTIYAHAVSPEEQQIAIDQLGAAVTVHPLNKDDPEAVARAAEAGVYEMTTLATLDSIRTSWQPERLNDPLVTLTVPAVELATARDPAVSRAYQTAMIHTFLPRMPARGLIRAVTFQERRIAKELGAVANALVALRDAGVPIVIGSDSGNWPILPFLFHGPTSVREIESLGEAGFTPEQALTAATRTPARMLGLEAEIGTLAPGRVADLVVVEGDPLADLAALREVRFSVRAGEAHTPAAWMAGTP
jgi:imidazolonepropionase-like amidohydrolase